MTCIPFNTGQSRGFICGLSPAHRLRLTDGTRVFMEWHHYLGPTFFRDRDCMREIDDWWDNELIVEAMDWFVSRGHRC